MSEEVLGVIGVMRPAFARTIYETLFFTPDRVIVARTSGGLGAVFGGIGAGIDAYRGGKKAEELGKLSMESVLTADKHNYAVSNSEITKVELRKKWTGIKINIETKDETGKWTCIGIPEKKKVKIEDYENILRPVFGDKLSVKK